MSSYRIRVGDYRIIYEIEDKVLPLLVIAVDIAEMFTSSEKKEDL